MTLLDRFRAPARESHPDPAVRLAYVEEIPIDERALLAGFARADEDARVRRAAVAKLMDPAVLADVARTDADEQVRGAANAMLRDIALEVFEGLAESDSLASVQAIADARVLAAVAKGAPNERVAREALARVADVHMLGSIARHAGHEAIRLQAFDGVRDAAEAMAVALKSEFKDTAAAAVDRFSDRAELEQIAERAKSRHAVKRARAVLREMDERAAAAAAAGRAAQEAADAEAAERAREAAEAQAREAARAQDEEALRAREARDAAVRLHEEADAAERARREIARRDAAETARRQETERRSVRLGELAEQAALAAAVEDAADARRQFAIVRREWRDLAAGITVPEDLAARFAAADQAIAARDAALREQDQKARHDALARLHHQLARLEPLAQQPDLDLKHAERALKDVRAALAQLPPLPTRQDYDDVLRRLKALQSTLTPKVQELRDVAGWQRWANVGIQEQLCEKMEALAAASDPEETAREIHQLQLQWRQAADVPRAQGAALWQRFKTAHDVAWARCEAHFAEQAGVRAENLAKKITLAERAESLADSTAWIQTAEALKGLQAEWKTIGPVTRGQEKAVWDRFRAACDRFFTRRQADLAERKTAWAENLAKKDALCVKAEALRDSTEWESAAAEIRRLQAEWKTIGPVKKSRSDAIWQRFRGACDAFFSRYAHRHDIARGERVAAREAIVAELEALAPSADSLAPASGEASVGPTREDIVVKVRDIGRRWRAELAARGVDRERAMALDQRYHAALARALAQHAPLLAGTDLDPDANRKRMESLVKRIEELAHSLGGSSSSQGDAALTPTARLATMLKEALAANTIGGKVDEESRWRAAAEDVRAAQASWSRLGPVPEEVRRALGDRFQRACRVITDRRSRI
jgi:hypothetical protein